MATQLPRSEFVKWVNSLTQEQLKNEIEREKAEQANREQTLKEVQERISDLEAELQEEKLTDQTDKINARRNRLEQLRKTITEFNNQVQAQKRRAAYYRGKLDEANERLSNFTATTTWRSFLPQNEAYRNTLKRSVAAYKGFLNREQDLVDKLIDFRASAVAEYAAINRWLKYESTLQERLLAILGSINFWAENARNLKATIAEEAWRIEYKLTLIVVEGLIQRLTITYYIIIDENTHDYPRDEGRRYRRKGGVAYRNRVRYPKGAFQAYLECDAFVERGNPRQDKEPFPSLDKFIRAEVIDEFEKEFKNPTRDGATGFRPEDLTLGIVSMRPKPEEVGKPPFKLYIERMSDGRQGWIKTVDEYLMDIEAYDSFTADMDEYRSALRRMK